MSCIPAINFELLTDGIRIVTSNNLFLLFYSKDIVNAGNVASLVSFIHNEGGRSVVEYYKKVLMLSTIYNLNSYSNSISQY
mmetsp:Transcript_54958/g.64274  ORF Transcript_54958/g.64274 Transcript_54958/m.64274 type:complete len:81 (-) Transcript_54958:611-853(-)